MKVGDIIRRLRLSQYRGIQAYNEALGCIKAFEVPIGWNGEIFQLPEPVIEALVSLILKRRLLRVLELGTGFGTTACILSHVFQQLGEGRVTTVDRSLHMPVNVQTLAEHCQIDARYLECIVETSGYLWTLGQMIANKENDPSRQFDLIFIDGAHEWDPDAGAFLLADRLLRKGGFLVLDDLNFRLSDLPEAATRFPNRSEEQLQALQVRMIWDLLIKTHENYGSFIELHGGRVGLARKR